MAGSRIQCATKNESYIVYTDRETTEDFVVNVDG